MNHTASEPRGSTDRELVEVNVQLALAMVSDPVQSLFSVFDGLWVLLFRSEAIVYGHDHALRTCQSTMLSRALERPRGHSRLHMLVEKAFSVLIVPSVHPPGEVEEVGQWDIDA